MAFNILDKLALGIENFSRNISTNFVGKTLSEYCSLDGAIGLTDDDKKRNLELSEPYILLNEERMLISAFEIQGTKSLVSINKYEEIIDVLRMKFDSYFSNEGHILSFAFERDDERAFEELKKLISPQLESAKRIGIDAEDIIFDRVKRNLPYISFEENYLIVITKTSVLSNDEFKSEMKYQQELVKKNNIPKIEFAQNPFIFLESMKVRHDSLLSRIEDDFKKAGILVEMVCSKELLKSIHSKISRGNTNFNPLIIGDKLTIAGDYTDSDYSNYLFPKLKYQMSNEFVDIHEKEVVQVGDYYHGNISLLLPQQETQPFDNLFKSIGKSIPYRVKIDIEPNGLNSFKTRRMILSFTNIFPGNKDITDAFKNLEEQKKVQAICLFKVTFSTWSKNKKETISNISALERAVQSWGICQVNKITGDPIASWASTIPAFTSKNLATKLVAPLNEVLQYLPFQRPATVWGRKVKGDLILRSPDGKIYPVGFGSSLQTTWLKLISSPPGSGKSVLMNSINACTTWSAGNKKLPYKTIVDIGGSSFGYINLVKDSVDESLKHQIIALKLRNSKEYAVNIFDTQLGCRYPTIRESEFAGDFLTLLCCDSSGKAPEGVSKIAYSLIDIAYKEKDKLNPNMYESGVCIDVDDVLNEFEKLNIVTSEWKKDLSWFEVTDFLFKNGKIKESALAHRYTSPVLSDFVSFLKNPMIEQVYGKANISTGEPILAYISRCLISANKNFEMFNGRTKFEISSETRIISIDLGEVIGNKTAEGKIKTTIMYLFARQLAAKNYFIDQETMTHICPPLYKEYHDKRINELTSSKKSIDYDEVHNTNGIESFEQTLLKDAREGRKWGIEITCISQYLNDFSKEMRAAATSIFLMSGSSEIDNKILMEEHEKDITSDLIRRFELEATGPTKDGGTFLAIFRTKLGKIIQLLTNTIGPIELWAFSSTMEDVALRNKLTKTFGSKNARSILAKEFPMGTAVRHIEKLKQTLEIDSSIIDYLAEDISKRYEGE